MRGSGIEGKNADDAMDRESAEILQEQATIAEVMMNHDVFGYILALGVMWDVCNN